MGALEEGQLLSGAVSASERQSPRPDSGGAIGARVAGGARLVTCLTRAGEGRGLKNEQSVAESELRLLPILTPSSSPSSLRSGGLLPSNPCFVRVMSP